MPEHKTKLLIIGSGPAGLTAAIYAARANLNPLVIAGIQVGGQLISTPDIENFPGFEEKITGAFLMEKMQKQAQNIGAQIIYDTITKVDLSKRPFICCADSGDVYSADALIIATGASPRWLGIEGEDKYRGFGISACATCDGFFFRDKAVCVIGGGNVAAEEALYLANIAEKVILIHRRDSLKAEKILQKAIFNNPKITVFFDTIPIQFIGKDNPLALSGVKIKNKINGKIFTINCEGAFVAIGYNPNTEMFLGQLDMDEAKFIKTKPDSSKTNVPGVFCAGDMKNPLFQQAIIAAGSGCIAALEADAFLNKQK